jgi:hypothetical protein
MITPAADAMSGMAKIQNRACSAVMPMAYLTG